MLELAERIKALPPYLFAQIDSLKRQKLAQGVDVIDLGVGDPDLPTPEAILEAMIKAVKNPAHHKYPSYEGMIEFRWAVAKYYKRRFGVDLDPDKEVLALIGSKEGIAHLPLGILNPGDLVLCPDPCYPPYKNGAILASADIYNLPLRWENDFLPDLESVPKQVLERAKLIWINYPNNPTSAGATLDFYKKLVAFAKKHGLYIASDLAYSEIYTGLEKPPSILEVEGAKDIAIEFYSFSKTFNMAGWRLGAAVGNTDLIKALGKVKTNIDSGQFQAIQEAGIRALELPEEELNQIRAVYRERRQSMQSALRAINIEVYPSEFTFYLWAKVPKGHDSAGFVSLLLNECGIVCTPGTGFGPSGEGFFRISLTLPTTRLLEACERIMKLKI